MGQIRKELKHGAPSGEQSSTYIDIGNDAKVLLDMLSPRAW